MTNWKDIHQDFGKEWSNGKTYQQLWEEYGFTKEEAREWINTGFKLWEYGIVKEWKNYEFTPQQAQAWIQIDLTKKEVDFAYYLKTQVATPSNINIKNLIQAAHQAQTYLDFHYPLEKRNEVKTLKISEKKIAVSLLIKDWAKLEEIECDYNQLDSLDLINCPELKTVYANNNQLTNLTISNCPEINYLIIGQNQLTSLDFLVNLNKEKITNLSVKINKFTPQDLTIFSSLINCEVLVISTDPDLSYGSPETSEMTFSPFFVSLEPLKNLSKLRKLYIGNTNLDSGLEYLPESLERFGCRNTKLDKVLTAYGKIYKDNNYLYLLHGWKKDHSDLVNRVQKITELENSLTNLHLALSNQILNETTDKACQVFMREAENKLRELKKQNQEYYEAKVEVSTIPANS